jgi:hypothetical protein
MSWDADLVTAGENRSIAWWNYTHNTNGMIAAAYEAATGQDTPQCGGTLGPAIGAAWWERLDGQRGDIGAGYLAVIVEALEADPQRFRAMDPPNGWGSYDTLLPVLRKMRDAPGSDGPHLAWNVSG